MHSLCAGRQGLAEWGKRDPWAGDTRNVSWQCPSSAASLGCSLGKEERETAQKGRQPHLMKEALGGLSGPQRGGHMSPGAAMQAKAERGRRKWNKWHCTACHPCDTCPGTTTAVGTCRQAEEQVWGSVRSQVEWSTAVGWGGCRAGPHSPQHLKTKVPLLHGDISGLGWWYFGDSTWQ